MANRKRRESDVALILQFSLATVLVVAGILKLRQRKPLETALETLLSRGTGSLVPHAVTAVAGLEVVTGLLWLFPATARLPWVSALAVSLFGAFLLTSLLLLGSQAPSCGCFGDWWLLNKRAACLRSALFLAAAISVYGAPSRAESAWTWVYAYSTVASMATLIAVGHSARQLSNRSQDS